MSHLYLRALCIYMQHLMHHSVYEVCGNINMFRLGAQFPREVRVVIPCSVTNNALNPF